MKTVVSTFVSAADARTAAQQLRNEGFGDDRVSFFAPGSTERALTSIPTDEGEAPGMGKAVGGVVGGAVGMATAMPLGAAMASALIPGVGAIIAVGAIATTVLGLTGAAVGGAIENALTNGVPKGDVFFIQEALREGRTVVVVVGQDEAQADSAREILSRAGGESLDAARDRWWLQLRNGEEAAYAGQGGSFRNEESLYRLGFECALAPDVRGRTGESLEAALEARHGDACKERAFRAGFARGCEYEGRREDGPHLRRSA